MLSSGHELCHSQALQPWCPLVPADPLHSLTFWIFLIWSESVSKRRVFRKSVTLATLPSM